MIEAGDLYRDPEGGRLALRIVAVYDKRAWVATVGGRNHRLVPVAEIQNDWEAIDQRPVENHCDIVRSDDGKTVTVGSPAWLRNRTLTRHEAVVVAAWFLQAADPGLLRLEDVMSLVKGAADPITPPVTPEPEPEPEPGPGPIVVVPTRGPGS